QLGRRFHRFATADVSLGPRSAPPPGSFALSGLKSSTQQSGEERKEDIMKSSVQLKTVISLVLMTITLVCAGFLPPNAFGVVPPPDAGYPGGNTAEGQAALLSLTTGGFNTAVGFFSLRSNTTGQLNTAVGAGTLLANTADENTATGAGALLSNTTGSSNTANG